MAKLLAVLVTLVAALMTSVAAWDRGGTLIDKALLVALSIVIVLAVHLLPALSRRPAAWLVWSGCLFCAIYGHLTFLTHASLRANQTYAEQSALNTGTENQIRVIRESLAHITARDVSLVAADLAKTSGRRERIALREELASSKKADQLREELVHLSKVSTEAKVTGAVDPVTAKLALVFGVPESVISVVIGLIFSTLLELIGALIWVEVLRPTHLFSTVPTDTTGVSSSASHAVTTDVTRPSSHATTRMTTGATPIVTEANSSETPAVTTRDSSHDETALKAAIESGKCKATVNGIREFLGCSQAKASELRRSLAM